MPPLNARAEAHRRDQRAAKRFGTNEVLKGIDLDGRARRGHRHHRQERLGQEHAAALHQRPRGLPGRHAHRRRQAAAARQRGGDARAAPARRHDLPELQPVPAPDGRQERDAGADAGEEAPPPRPAASRRGELLARVGLAEKFDACPDQLSGGQQQRVAIARALAMEPAVLLCDEITSALDPELVGEVLRVVESLAAEGMTLLMVTHEMSFARKVCDRVVFMHEGRVHEIGPPEQIFGAPQTPSCGSSCRRSTADPPPAAALDLVDSGERPLAPSPLPSGRTRRERPLPRRDERGEREHRRRARRSRRAARRGDRRRSRPRSGRRSGRRRRRS